MPRQPPTVYGAQPRRSLCQTTEPVELDRTAYLTTACQKKPEPTQQTNPRNTYLPEERRNLRSKTDDLSFISCPFLVPDLCSLPHSDSLAIYANGAQGTP